MKKLLTFLTLLTLSIGVGWAAETEYYTLDGTITSPSTPNTNSQYDAYSDITQSNITWKVKGNTTMNPWRIGGKSLTNTDRDIYSTAAMGSAISKVSLTVGAAQNITVNSLKLIVASDASFTNQIDVVSASFAANSTINFTPTSGTEWATGAYYKFVFNVTVSGSSNRFVQFIGATFYKNEGGTVTPTVQTPVIAINPSSGPYYVGDEVTASISCGTEGASILYSLDNGTTWEAYSSAVTIPSTTAGAVTIKAKATMTDYNDSGEATASVTFVNPPTTFNNLADVNNSSDNTEFTFTAQTVVLGKSRNSLYIVMPDNSAGTLVYASSNWASGYTFGQVVNNGWGGKKTTYRTKPEVTNPSGFELVGTTAEVTPIEISSNTDLTLANFGRYAVIKNVQVAADGTFSELNTYNQFSITPSGAGKYDVYGVIGYDSENGQFMPIEYSPRTAAYTITVNQPAAGGEISASAATADEGDEITLTATPAAGYEFTSWTVTDNDGAITVTDNKFTVRTSNVTVTATFSLKNYVVDYQVIPSTAAANSGNRLGLISGAPYDPETQASHSQMGTLVTIKLYTANGWQIDDANVSVAYTDADGNPATLTPTKGETNSDDGGYGTYFTFTMPASDVMINAAFQPYQPDVYILGNLNGGAHWNDGGLMMTRNSNNTYSIRVYASDENGYFRFYANGGTNGSPSYGATNDNDNPLGGVQNLWNNSGNNFCVPAGIYDIVVGQVYDDPTTSSNPNWWNQTTVTVTKVEPTLTFTPAAGEVPNNQVVTVSSNLYELLSAINSEVDENDVTNMVKTDGDYAASVTLTDAATVTGRAKYSNIEQTATAAYTIMQENTNTQYKLITSKTDLVAGKKYIVVYETGNKAMGERNGSNYYRNATAVEIDAQHVTDIAGLAVSELILGGEEDAWTFQVKDNEKYLSYASSSAYLTEADAVGDANKELFTISFDDDDALIVSNAATDRSIRYNSSSGGRFGLYVTLNNQGNPNTNQPIVQLYRQVENVVTQKVATPVIDPGTDTYASAQTVTITCSTPGATIYYKTTEMDDYAEYTASLTISENTTLTAYATKDGYTDSEVATAIYTFSELSTDVFTLVTDESQLVAGNEYIIVAATDTYKPALGAIESRNGTPANGYTFETAGNYSQLTLASESDVNILILGETEPSSAGEDFKWTLKQKSDDKYIYADKSGGAIDTESASNYSNIYKIAIGSGSNYNNYATIQASAGYQIEYRTDNNIFRHYASSNVNQNNVYKKVLLYTRGTTPVVESKTLAQIEASGTVNTKYAVADPYLVAVACAIYNDDVYLWCKDEATSNSAVTVPTSSDNIIDFMRQPGKTDPAPQVGDWDQSNWVALKLTGGAATDMLEKAMSAVDGGCHKITGVTGVYMDNVNFTMEVPYTSFTVSDAVDFTPNVYCVANFNPANLGENGVTVNGKTYFFMTPKVQEVCTVTYAQWNGNNFIVPVTSGFQGTLNIDYKYNDASQSTVEAALNGRLDGLEEAAYYTYTFTSIVQVPTASGAPALKAAGNGYIVNPTNLTAETTPQDPVTAISTVSVNGEVKSVKYVNVAGVVSDRPFSGVNIVVTEYSDGSRTTTKMLRK